MPVAGGGAGAGGGGGAVVGAGVAGRGVGCGVGAAVAGADVGRAVGVGATPVAAAVADADGATTRAAVGAAVGSSPTGITTRSRVDARALAVQPSLRQLLARDCPTRATEIVCVPALDRSGTVSRTRRFPRRSVLAVGMDRVDPSQTSWRRVLAGRFLPTTTMRSPGSAVDGACRSVDLAPTCPPRKTRAGSSSTIGIVAIQSRRLRGSEGGDDVGPWDDGRGAALTDAGSALKRIGHALAEVS